MYKQLPDDLQVRLWGYSAPDLTRTQLKAIRANLEPFDLWGVEDRTPDAVLPLPDCVQSLEQALADSVQDFRPRLDLLTEAAQAPELKRPPLPSAYPRLPGWYRLSRGAWEPSATPPPPGIYIADLETYSQDPGQKIQRHWLPFCLGALELLTGELWVWLTDWDSPVTALPVDQSLRDSIVVNHNCPYDRQYFLAEYLIEGSGNSWVDTMSLWIQTHGMCNQQRPVYKLYENDD